jgi:hypothetical protein
VPARLPVDRGGFLAGCDPVTLWLLYVAGGFGVVAMVAGLVVIVGEFRAQRLHDFDEVYRLFTDEGRQR